MHKNQEVEYQTGVALSKNSNTDIPSPKDTNVHYNGNFISANGRRIGTHLSYKYGIVAYDETFWGVNELFLNHMIKKTTKLKTLNPCHSHNCTFHDINFNNFDVSYYKTGVQVKR